LRKVGPQNPALLTAGPAFVGEIRDCRKRWRAQFGTALASVHKCLRPCDLRNELAFGILSAQVDRTISIQLVRIQKVMPPVPGEPCENSIMAQRVSSLRSSVSRSNQGANLPRVTVERRRIGLRRRIAHCTLKEFFDQGLDGSSFPPCPQKSAKSQRREKGRGDGCVVDRSSHGQRGKQAYE